jgi:hypothetical protein
MHGLSGLVVWLLIALGLGMLWDGSILRDMRRKTLQDLRKVVGWQFAGSSVASLLVAAWLIPGMLGRGTRGSLVREVCVVAILPSMAAMYGVAWWAVWKERPSAKVWAVAASLASLLGSLWLISHSWRLARWCTWFTAALSIAWLVLFLWPNESQTAKVADEPS